MAQKMEFFNFGLDQKLDHHSCVEFHSDSDGDGFKTQKLMINLLIVLKCISIIVRIPVTTRGLEFASQLWLLSLIWVLASTRALLKKQKLIVLIISFCFFNHYLTVGFYRIKKY